MATDRENILLVGGETKSRQLYQEQLGDAGYRVAVCSDCENAVAMLRSRPFSVVVLDLTTAGNGSSALIELVGSLPSFPAVVALADAATFASVAPSDPCEYLSIPFFPQQLLRAVRISRHRRDLLAENVRLKGQIQLCRAGHSLSSLIDLECLIPQALKTLMVETGAEKGCSFIVGEGSEICLTDVENFDGEEAQRLLTLLLPDFQATTGLVRPSAECADPLQEMFILPESVRLLSLRDGEKLCGGLVVFSSLKTHSGEIFETGDLFFLCDQIALGFANASRYQSAQQLMYTDDLTGLYNHRYLQIAMHQEIMRSKRYGLKFSMMFLDLDHFKEINDHYGHLAGSAALKEVGQLMRRCVRDIDTLFRFGGDEFAVILVETDKRGARIVAERIRNLMENYEFFNDMKLPCRVTITIGLATFPDDAVTSERLLDLADQAMYAGKNLRNSICDVDEIENPR